MTQAHLISGPHTAYRGEGGLSHHAGDAPGGDHHDGERLRRNLRGGPG